MYPFDYEAAAFRAEHRDAPFFLYVGSAHPHRAAVAFGNHEQPAGVEPVPYDPEKVIVPNFLPDVAQVREDLTEYYQSLSGFDQVVGTALAELEALFDMEADPCEPRNLIDEPALAGVASEMRAKVLAFRQATADP